MGGEGAGKTSLRVTPGLTLAKAIRILESSHSSFNVS